MIGILLVICIMLAILLAQTREICNILERINTQIRGLRNDLADILEDRKTELVFSEDDAQLLYTKLIVPLIKLHIEKK